MKIFSNYNFTPDWIKEYYDDYLIYDRSDSRDYLKDFPQDKIIYVENKGSDISDKFLWIIENYGNLPDIVLLSKSNLFKYITKQEFDLVKDNKTFTPLFSQAHKETYIDFDKVNKRMIPEIETYGFDQKTKDLFYKLNMVGKTGIKEYSFYDKDGMYNELNIPAYLSNCPAKSYEIMEELMKLLGIWDLEYVKFAPGSNYILPKENILKHSREFYQKLRSYLEWAVYPGEAMLVERGLYTLWK